VKIEDITAIKQMGEKTAIAISDFFNEPENLHTLCTLTLDISNPDFDTKSSDELPLSGKSFVITGTMTVPRKEIKEEIEKMGGHVTGSVSKSTDFLIAGQNPGSKQAKAEEYGINVVSYEELLKMLTAE
jgi:DNA ligase (NAD+)